MSYVAIPTSTEPSYAPSYARPLNGEFDSGAAQELPKTRTFAVPRKPVFTATVQEKEPTPSYQPPPPGWPAHPQILGRRGPFAVWLPLRLWDIVLALCPIAFLSVSYLLSSRSSPFFSSLKWNVYPRLQEQPTD